MNDDFIFRILFIVLILVFTFIRAYYARKGQITDKKRSARERWEERTKIEGKTRTIIFMADGVFIVIAIVLYLFSPPWLLWSQIPFPSLLRWIGFGFGIATIPFLVWVQHTLGKHWTPSLELREDHTLVTSGPYSRVRHPMYTISSLIFLALILVSADLLILIGFLIAIILALARIPKEEQMMLDQFGEEYRTYMKRTGRLLPRLRR